MTKDFEARALEKAREHCKEKRPLDWTLEELDAFLAGARWGREAGLDLAAGIAYDHGNGWDDSYGNACRTITEAIRAAKEKKGSNE